MSAFEDNPMDDQPFDKDEYEAWEKEHAKEQRAEESMRTRRWKPISNRRLKAIVDDTEQETPDGNYSDDDVYRIAAELEDRRNNCRCHGKPEDGPGEEP